MQGDRFEFLIFIWNRSQPALALVNVILRSLIPIIDLVGRLLKKRNLKHNIPDLLYFRKGLKSIYK